MFRQSVHLVALMLAHITGDMYGGLLAAILPVLCAHFQLSLSGGLLIITFFVIVTNLCQVIVGHLPFSSSKPWLICAGLAGAALLPLIGLMPAGAPNLFILGGLLLLSGIGVAVIHPDGLRGIHHLQKVPSSVSTACFMVGGFVGFSAGAWLSGSIVDRYGLPGLVWLSPLCLIPALALPLLGVRLAVEPKSPAQAPVSEGGVPRYPFGHLFVMATLVATSATLITSLIPTFLNHQGHSLSFGGRSVFLFGIGGAVGSLFWGFYAHHKGYWNTLRLSLSLGPPCLIAYLLLSRHVPAMWILLAAGFALYTSYPLIVTLSRYAHSRFTLSQRMGLIVGGAWGLAGLFLIGLGPIGERFGLAPLLHLAWLNYVAALIYGTLVLRQIKRQPSA